MATLSEARYTHAFRVAVVNLFYAILGRLAFRRCIVVALALMLAGLSIPLLIAVGWLPATFPLGFLGWALVAVGGYRLLTRCGEI